MENYNDLYNFDAIKLNENPNFNTILGYFSNEETTEKYFEYIGQKIKAKRKFTYIGGQGKMFKVKTNYLHVWILNDKKPYLTKHYKQQKDGSFKLM